MNERLEGWKLALLLLVPLAIIGLAVFIGIGLLTDDGDDTDEQEVATDVLPTPTALPTATAIPQTQPVDVPDEEPTPTPVPIPVESPTPLPEPTETPTPEPTTPPAGGGGGDNGGGGGDNGGGGGDNGGGGGGGTPSTPTPDPSVLTVACSVVDGTFPSALEIGEAFGPLRAVVSPPEAEPNLTFFWNYGDGTIASAVQTGLHSYDLLGTYAVTLRARDSITGADLFTNCGDITVGEAEEDLVVSCSVRPEDPNKKFKDATPPQPMTVTVNWRPRGALLTLQFDFGPNIPVEFVENTESSVSRTWTYLSYDDAFSIFWRQLSTGATGTLLCPAYPDNPNPAPVQPTAVVTATVVPTVTPAPTPTP